MQTDLFDFQTRTRVVFGAGALEQLGELTRGLPAQRVLLVTDPGLVAAGHAPRAQRILERAGVRVTVFDRVRENPTTRCVEDCVAVARAAGIEALIGLGGGSALDTAKGCNFLLTNGGRMEDYRGIGRASRPMLPFIAIPTTAGTGSELQCATLIADEHTHQKMACLDPKCAARVAVLDPELTLSQPARVTACSGLDAIAHAVESAVTTKRNALSERLSRRAFELCAGAFPVVLREPQNLEARARMQLGAALAGAAIENSMLGAAHAAANPLTAHFDVTHGLAVGLMLPHVVRFNAVEATARGIYATLAQAAGLSDGALLPEEALARRLEEWLALTGLPRSLGECGVSRADIPMLASEAARQWTAGFNPRPVGAVDFVTLYTAALGQGG
ncbi:MAG: iron-containing alcohol dehydrogenase [Verrucomicrobiales bacterium]|nr:iron-containing alcohol dehydrogenase [Verrucomicrobiales bacterium]